MDRRTRKSKEALKTALIKLLETKKINEIQVKQLCEQADVNRSTFYSNYYDIYEILSEIYQDTIHAISSHVIHLALGGESTRENVYQAIYQALTYFQENDGYFNLLFSQPAKIRFEEMLYLHYMNSYGANQLEPLKRYRFLNQIIGGFSIVRAWMAEGYIVSTDDMTTMLLDLIRDDLDIFPGGIFTQ